MRFLSFLATAALASTAAARSSKHVKARNLELQNEPARQAVRMESRAEAHPPKTPKKIVPQNYNTTKFAVNGTAIPDVNFDIGESYAGLLPISDKANSSELYFWYFPSENVEATDEILIWLNGGPGCSSLEGLLQENGIFQWQYGTFAPVKNQWWWGNLTNVVWVEQPAGTGFSQKRGTPSATNEIEVAEQFLGFFKNFVDTFSLHNRKVYITGESYAGYYVPYIADAMHNTSDTTYYDVQAIQINDPSTSYDVVQQDIPTAAFVNYWDSLFSLNQTFMDYLNNASLTCGYTQFLDSALTFPPTGLLPTPPNVDYTMEGCTLWNDVINAAQLVNPCWDVYQVATTCPLLWDVLGFPGSFTYEPPGAFIYFNRTDVQTAINAPHQVWEECVNDVLVTDTSPPSGLSVLPRVIEKNKRTVIAHGLIDMILVMNGTLVMIQNMTWNGAQGFSVPPAEFNEFFVPYHSELNLGTIAASGIMGNWHTERGLTFCTVDLSGHMIPQYQPSAAYRQLEFLLGRIEDLSERTDFTTQRGAFGNNITFTTANDTADNGPGAKYGMMQM